MRQHVIVKGRQHYYGLVTVFLGTKDKKTTGRYTNGLQQGNDGGVRWITTAISVRRSGTSLLSACSVYGIRYGLHKCGPDHYVVIESPRID